MNMSFDFKGKIAFITGAATGMGKTTAIMLAKAGADVLIADFNEKDGKATMEECKKLGVRSTFYQVDVADEASAKGAAKAALDEYGHVDFLINNAGISGKDQGYPITKISIADFRRVMDINVIGYANMVQAFYENFTSRKQGKIVCTSSIAGVQAQPFLAHYAASKAAAISFTRSMAVEFGPYNVNVNALAPGFVYTPIYYDANNMFKGTFPGRFDDCETSEQVMEKLASNSAMRRAQTEEDMAYGIMILCAEETKNITGQTLIIDSGRTLM